MKSILVVLFVALSSFGNLNVQETDKMNATFAGYEDGMYVFTDSDGYQSEFNYVSQDVSQQFDLTDKQYVGKQFTITYTVDTEIDEEDEEIQVSTIVGLMMPQ
jgi:hypothetical protein